MGLPALLMPLLLAATPAATQPPDDGGWSWCVADLAAGKAPTRYFSDPFQGESDVSVEGAFREYVVRSYPAAKGGAIAVQCRLFPTRAAADAALRTASAAATGGSAMMTAWRFHFE